MTRNDPPGFDPTLYDVDFFTWTQRQAAALRSMPRNASIDIEHVSEEIEDLGKRDIREVSSFLARLIEHLLKVQALPSSLDREHWLSEAVHLQDSAVAAFTPGMRQRLDLATIWERGVRRARHPLRAKGPTDALSKACPFDLDDLLSPDFDLDAALAKLAAARDMPRP